MEANRASATAAMMAAYRARASAQPRPLMNDPWAAALAGVEGQGFATDLERAYPHLELWTAVRTWYLDAHVHTFTAAPHAFRKVVLLGAGLDSRAARLRNEGVKFFEIDHPATQGDKRARIAKLPGYPVDAATFVPCDFEKAELGAALSVVGAEAPAVVLWEGVAPYLPEPAIRATLTAIATSLHPRSVVVFDHLLKNQADPKRHDENAQGVVKDMGEPVRWGTNDPVPLLFETGYRHVRSVSFDEACLTLTGTYQRERQFRFQRMVTCSVVAPDGLRLPAGP
jgi:methyltransferase (TIGR00027 family)